MRPDFNYNLRILKQLETLHFSQPALSGQEDHACSSLQGPLPESTKSMGKKIINVAQVQPINLKNTMKM